MTVDANSKAAAQPRKPPPTSGLDRFLAEIETKKKVNVLDKTKMDWKEYKKTVRGRGGACCSAVPVLLSTKTWQVDINAYSF